MAQKMPIRTRTDMSMSEEDAVPGEDTSEVTRLFHERLQAFKHACGYLEDYITSTEKMQSAHAKESEKVLKTVSNPLKEGHHFDQNLGGVAEMFDNIRSNTQGMANQHAETAKILKSTVLPIFDRLHSEIKNKQKELAKGVGKGTKAVDKARSTTQKHIELLGQHAAAHDSAGGNVSASMDPFVLQKGVYHRLHRQIQEENSSRQDLLTVQSNFSQFEAHVIEIFQQGMGYLMQTMGTLLDNQKGLYGNMVAKAQSMNPLFEWNGFVKRNSTVLIDPNAPQRTLESVSFPNQNHRATQPMIQGSLERKSGVLRKFEAGFYVVSASKFLHEFKTDDNISRDPSPELSLHLPDATMGGLNGNAFNIKGKDVSGGKMGAAISHRTEYAFRAHSGSDAEKWYRIIEGLCGSGSVSATTSVVTSPVSPADSTKSGANTFGPTGSRNVSGASTIGTPTSARQETGITSPVREGGYGGMGASGVQGKPGEY